MIAMALACNPRLLIADEPTTALDVTIQAQILELFEEPEARLGMGMILITHDLGVVAGMADSVAVMYGGEMVEAADVQSLLPESAASVYAGAASFACRAGRRAQRRLVHHQGQPPDLLKPPPGCIGATLPCQNAAAAFA